jgi:alanyl-tRNA synthetase
VTVDEAGFENALEEQRRRSRQDYESGKVHEQIADSIYEGTTTFVGYEYRAPVSAVIQEILVDGEPSERITEGQKGELFLDTTPFYAEAGGQVGDTGAIASGENCAEISDTRYRGTSIAHVFEIRRGSFHVGDRIDASVAMDKRLMTMKNHTATHLMHQALKQVLGGHVKQAGSLVAPDRLRFDFTHFAPLTRAEIEKIEDGVNEQIWRNAEVKTSLMNLEEALASGAVALFGEKYQESVRVVDVPGYSRELCGGTHVSATGSIGMFKIISESGIAAGIRRIEAITGIGALQRFRSDEDVLDLLRTEYKVQRTEIPALMEKLHRQIRDLEREKAESKIRDARTQFDSLLSGIREISGIKILAQVIPETDRASMRTLADDLREKLGSGVVVLGTAQKGKAALVIMVTKDLAKKLPAGEIIREIAPVVGGSGGGKPELAEAGGKDSAKLADAIERSYRVVETLLTTQFS